MTNGEAIIAAQQDEIARLRDRIFGYRAVLNLKCSQLATAREALSHMLVDPPASLDEPDMDAEVIVKLRQIALRALNATGGDQPNLEEPRG